MIDIITYQSVVSFRGHANVRSDRVVMTSVRHAFCGGSRDGGECATVYWSLAHDSQSLPLPSLGRPTERPSNCLVY